MSLDGKVAIVTGAGRGIGRAIALGLADLGAKVVVNDHGVDLAGMAPSAEPAGEVVSAILARGHDAVAHVGSVADARDVEEMVAGCIARFGRLDILVNNAGLIIRNLVVDTPEDEWRRQIDVSLTGSFLCARAAAPHMVRQGFGRIINFTSDAGLLSYPGANAYACAKAGIVALTKVLAQELAFDGVTVNAIAPAAATRMGEVIPPAVQRIRAALGVTPRGGVPPAERVPEPVAAMVAYLASEEAASVTGQVIGIKGSRIDLWSSPSVVATAFNDGLWTLEAVRRRFAQSIGRKLTGAGPAARP